MKNTITKQIRKMKCTKKEFAAWLALSTVLISLFLPFGVVYADTFKPDDKVKNAISWIISFTQFLAVAGGAIMLGPIALNFIRGNQQKVEEGKDKAINVMIGLAIAFLGLAALKFYVQSVGGTWQINN